MYIVLVWTKSIGKATIPPTRFHASKPGHCARRSLFWGKITPIKRWGIPWKASWTKAGRWRAAAGIEDGIVSYLRNPSILTIILILQMIEGLTDEQAANAIRERVDWKYALHLPLVNNGMDARWLCQFRREVIQNQAARTVFEAVLARFPQQLYARMLPANMDGDHLVKSVCAETRLQWMVSAMTEVVDYLAFICPDWMRQHGLPHWHNRYNRDLARPGAWQQVGWEENMQAIAWDAAYLFNAIEQDPFMGAEPAQVKRLRAVITQQYQPQADARTGLAAPSALCSFCQLNS